MREGRRNREGTECISAPPAETREMKGATRALEDTDTFAGENAEK